MHGTCKGIAEMMRKRMNIYWKLLPLTVVFILAGLIGPASAADLSIFHAPAPTTSSVNLDDSVWTTLLKKYIEAHDGLNYFQYSEVEDSDLELLENYLDERQAVVVTELTADQQFAYWVNLYNALTVWVILEHYPIDSIRDISYSLLTRGPWKEELVTVQGVDLSLDDIEHEILRPVFADSRIHYAVNCASIGCPNLQTMAFSSINLEALLEESARQYINHPRGVRIEGDELIVSSIFDWYQDDFGGSEIEVIEHLIEYALEPLQRKLRSFVEIDDYEYDWSLNE